MGDKKEIVIVDEQSLKDKVYVIRGQQVMLDSDLAELYGYETKNFNRQVNNNKERFPDDFMFQLTSEEVKKLSRCKNCTSSWGGSRYIPHAFTEQGIYMLMTVLKGELAIEQSKALIRLFKVMKDYIIDNQQITIQHKDYISLVHKVENNTNEIQEIKNTLVTKKDLSDFIKLFESNREAEEILILDGQPFKADIAYQKIYGKAKKNIIVIDDYIGIKTLYHLSDARKNIMISIISDNKGRFPLRKSDYEDFKKEYPEIEISFITSDNRIYDRYIILDYGTSNIKVYHCGASSKDTGNRITTITEIRDVSDYESTVKDLLSNQALLLK